MIKILIADERKIVREGIKHIILNCPDIEVNGEANDAEEAIYLNWRYDYDAILLQDNIPGGEGQDTVKLLKNEKPGLSILILSLEQDKNPQNDFKKNVASGYITNRCTPEELIDTIRTMVKAGIC